MNTNPDLHFVTMELKLALIRLEQSAKMHPKTHAINVFARNTIRSKLDRFIDISTLV